MSQEKTIALAAALILTATTQGAIVLKGDFVNGTQEIGGTTVPTLTITEDIEFDVLVGGTLRAIVFDEWLVNPNPPVVQVSVVGGSQPLNVVNNSTVATPLAFTLGDGGEPLGDITVRDGYLVIGDIEVNSGTIFTVRAGSITFLPNSGFNPELNGRTFSGNAFLAGGPGLAFSAPTPIPEPSAALLCFLGASLLFRRKR